jgi:hypothetical protein
MPKRFISHSKPFELNVKQNNEFKWKCAIHPETGEEMYACTRFLDSFHCIEIILIITLERLRICNISLIVWRFGGTFQVETQL